MSSGIPSPSSSVSIESGYHRHRYRGRHLRHRGYHRHRSLHPSSLGCRHRLYRHRPRHRRYPSPWNPHRDGLVYRHRPNRRLPLPNPGCHHHRNLHQGNPVLRRHRSPRILPQVGDTISIGVWVKVVGIPSPSVSPSLSASSGIPSPSLSTQSGEPKQPGSLQSKRRSRSLSARSVHSPGSSPSYASPSSSLSR